ncbi:hypothetical protein MIND_00864300 [Mycena indigotica]|uniref:DUF862-domain-containing protein n=1 Tax=Mycena indigotica TaxID=2126181 RepID=A0A8H6SIW6_9AGAR|nr:uncharacterized protein MIND_00864300 [Mycena indigotica]KAF7299157.1 hypothetical protein MIND_00864300 [Mycena indigotica]
MSSVKLYIYDLSNGLAKSLSQQLTGRQIDGIWHTSIVVFGKETFYGQGISVTLPGRSHHGQPLQVVDLGETMLDEETWQEYLEEMRTHYTADKYHLLDFNCNSFTNDCAGFLTGGSIPAFVRDLPTDFLSTPFGAALRPTIDAMYRRPSPGAPEVPPPTPNQPIASSLLQAVASQAQQPATTSIQPPPLAATESLAGPMHTTTNSASFRTLLQSHRAVVALFTDPAGCAPCRMIAPYYEDLAIEKGLRSATSRGATFTKIDPSVGSGQALCSEWGIRAYPTFMFFLNGKKTSELRGADPGELRAQVDLLLFEAYPPHPHASLPLPGMKTLSLSPILFTQVPALDAVLTKLVSFIDAAPQSPHSTQAKEILRSQVVPFLKSKFGPDKPKAPPPTNVAFLTAWGAVTMTLVGALPKESLFPLVDMWRLAVLDPATATWLAGSPGAGPVGSIIKLAQETLESGAEDKGARNFVLTALRLLTNAFGNSALSRVLLAGTDGSAMSTLVPALLHADSAVRTAAASLAFNASVPVQRVRVNTGAGLGGLPPTTNVDPSDVASAADEDWQVELVSALTEALKEESGEEVIHRLAGALACLLRFAPNDGQVWSLVEVLDVKAVVSGKAAVVNKKEVQGLITDVASLVG